MDGREEELRQREYGEFSMKLIVAGADMHALDDADQTPFAYMLRSCTTWRSEGLATATQRWGNILQEAGGSLQAYMEHENRLLANFDIFAAGVHIYDGLGGIWTCRLTILESSILAIEVGGSVICPIWEYRAPPGAWRQNASQVNKIIWPPDPRCDNYDRYLWRKAKDLVIKLSPTLLNAAPSSLEVSISTWRELATGSQDDHGFVASSSQRASNTSDQRRPRRRAISLPPPITMVHEEYGLPVAETSLRFDRGHWLSQAHKCPLYLCWRSMCRSGRYDGLNRYRWCMLGLCGGAKPNLVDTDHWEAQLLTDEGNLEIARRFIARFRPEWKEILERNHMEAQWRTELG